MKYILLIAALCMFTFTGCESLGIIFTTPVIHVMPVEELHPNKPENNNPGNKPNNNKPKTEHRKHN